MHSLLTWARGCAGIGYVVGTTAGANVGWSVTRDEAGARGFGRNLDADP